MQILALAVFASVAFGDEESAPNLPAALERGVEILLEMQEDYTGEDGPRAEWPYEGVYRERGDIPIGYRVGGTSICAWSLLDAPGWTNDSPRAVAVDRALEFVLASLGLSPMQPGFSRTYDVRGWGHAYALTFLLRLRELERVPSEREKDVDAAIETLVDTLEKTEIPERGGWNYARRRGGSEPNAPSTFMTASTLQALFAAKAQGVEVDEAVVERALGSLENARLENTAFQYASNPARVTGEGFEAVPGAIGRMPICEATLMLAKRGSVTRVRESIEAFFEHWEWLEKRRKQTGTHVPPYMIAPYYFYYAHMYLAQAIELLPEGERPAARERLYELLFKVREESGGWNDRVFPRSENFGTAMTLLAFTRPEHGLPPGWK